MNTVFPRWIFGETHLRRITITSKLIRNGWQDESRVWLYPDTFRLFVSTNKCHDGLEEWQRFSAN